MGSVNRGCKNHPLGRCRLMCCHGRPSPRRVKSGSALLVPPSPRLLVPPSPRLLVPASPRLLDSPPRPSPSTSVTTVNVGVELGNSPERGVVCLRRGEGRALVFRCRSQVPLAVPEGAGESGRTTQSRLSHPVLGGPVSLAGPPFFLSGQTAPVGERGVVGEPSSVLSVDSVLVVSSVVEDVCSPSKTCATWAAWSR